MNILQSRIDKERYIKAVMLKLRETTKVLTDLNFCGNINCQDCLMCYTENERNNCLLVLLKNLAYTASPERPHENIKEEIIEESPLKVDIVEK